MGLGNWLLLMVAWRRFLQYFNWWFSGSLSFPSWALLWWPGQPLLASAWFQVFRILLEMPCSQRKRITDDYVIQGRYRYIQNDSYITSVLRWLRNNRHCQWWMERWLVSQNNISTIFVYIGLLLARLAWNYIPLTKLPWTNIKKDLYLECLKDKIFAV